MLLALFSHLCHKSSESLKCKIWCRERFTNCHDLQQKGHGNLSEEYNVLMCAGEWCRTLAADADTRLLHLGHSVEGYLDEME